uniref:F-box domain-containing protein n=1 Tax=Caenorhabditis tropicalis TaxID=1561998 RepID=A0A1I7UTG4_9PELO
MRVCRSLHDFIYRSPPIAIAVILKVLVGNDSVFIRFQHSQPDSQYSVKFIILSFHYHKNGCLIVSADGSEKFLKDEDFLSVACDYLRFYLRWVGTIIQFEIEHRDDWFRWKPRFSFGETLKSSLSAFIKPCFQLPTFEEIRTTIWETIEECLQSRICPLRVRELILAIEEPRIHILNLLDPKAWW